MIIFGTRGVSSTTGSGRFYCPRCEQERPYHSKRMRRFFTLYFIPLIPMDVLDEWVECGQCGQAFKPEVLRYDPEDGRTVADMTYNDRLDDEKAYGAAAGGVQRSREDAAVRAPACARSGLPPGSRSSIVATASPLIPPETMSVLDRTCDSDRCWH